MRAAFLGLDNIGVFDRSAMPLPTGGYLEQADASTAWMALFSQNMLEIGVELAARYPAYAELATKFAGAVPLDQWPRNERGRSGRACGMRWTGSTTMSFAFLTVVRRGSRCTLHGGAALPSAPSQLLSRGSGTAFRSSCAPSWSGLCGECRTYSTASTRFRGRAIRVWASGGIVGLVNQDRLRRILSRMLDENEFLSPHGIRALSCHHAEHPFVVSGCVATNIA